MCRPVCVLLGGVLTFLLGCGGGAADNKPDATTAPGTGDAAGSADGGPDLSSWAEILQDVATDTDAHSGEETNDAAADLNSPAGSDSAGTPPDVAPTDTQQPDSAGGDGAAADALVDDATPDVGPTDSAVTASDTGPDVTDADSDAAGIAPDGTADSAASDSAAPPASACPAGCPPPAAPCQTAMCHPQAGCLTVVLPDGTICSDGDLCSQVDLCANGACVGSGWKNCDDANPCTLDACQLGVCSHTPLQGTACDDGDDCTVESLCQAGVCSGGIGVCACASSADCADLNDTDPCTPSWYCSPASHTCVVNPASVVACPEDGNPCTAAACDPATGKCQTKPVPNGVLCDDNNPCTQGDGCQSGQCAPGANFCCKSLNDCAALEDGDACNGKLFCNLATGQCQLQPQSVVVCPNGLDDACKQTVCEKQTGQCKVIWTAAGTSCDDGNPCTESACLMGSCTPGTSICPCQADADCASQEDGNVCNGTLYCDLAEHACKLNPATVVVCPSGADTDCAVNTCDAKSGQCGFVSAADGAPCDADGNACTQGDSCVAGACKPGPSTCSCQTAADCTAAEDGNLCNGTLYCDQISHTCQVNPATVVSCAVGQPGDCQAELCLPHTGQCVPTPLPAGTACDDGNPCTVADVCSKGECQPGASICACQQDADCTTREDGDKCNGTLYCNVADGTCEVNPASVIACPASADTDCVRAVCQPKTGQCVPTPVVDFSPCDADNNLCTPNDQCLSGVCKAGANLCQCNTDQGCALFDDANACNGKLTCTASAGVGKCVVSPATVILCPAPPDAQCSIAACDPALGLCVAVPLADGLTCTDGIGCTAGDLCVGGSCVGGKPGCDDGEPCTIDACDPVLKNCTYKGLSCNDGNVCTTDACWPKAGCQFTPQTAPCEDGDACTLGDSCNGGVCQAGSTAADCDDGAACTLDWCLPQLGCLHAPINGSCDDGDACTAADGCDGGVCTGVAIDCDDGNSCTTDTCELAGGCAHEDLVATSCDDGNACTIADACSAGSCTGVTTCSPTQVCDPAAGCGCQPGYFWTAVGCSAALGGVSLGPDLPVTNFAPGTFAYVMQLGFAANTAALRLANPHPALQFDVDGVVLVDPTVPHEVELPVGSTVVSVSAWQDGTLFATWQLTTIRAGSLLQVVDGGIGGVAGATRGSALVLPPGQLLAGEYPVNPGRVSLRPRVGVLLGQDSTIDTSPGGTREGYAIAVDGTRMAVTQEDGGNGILRFWTESKGVWSNEANFLVGTFCYNASCILGAGQHGLSMAGHWLAVGVPDEDSNTALPTPTAGNDGAPGSGAVLMLSRESGSWVATQWLKSSAIASWDHFGTAVAMQGDALFVGSPYEEFAGEPLDSGVVHIFVRSGNTWTRTAGLKAPNAGGNDRFGQSLAVSGDWLAVGAVGESSGKGGLLPDPDDNSAAGAGAVYLFHLEDGEWLFHSYLKAQWPDPSDNFGAALALQGGRLLVGAPAEDGGGSGLTADPLDNSKVRAGAAYLFQRLGQTWVQTAYIKAPQAEADARFGGAVALQGDVLAVSAPLADGPLGINQGLVVLIR